MSRRLLLLMLTCFSCPVFSGCAVHQLRDDQDQIRSVLLTLYTNQVMDNLVRAVNGLPIIQLDYTNVNSQVVVDANIAAGDGLATSHSNTLTVLALKSILVTRNLMNTLTSSVNVTNTNLVAIQANPVTTSNELYDAYLRYLAEPGSLQVSECPPPKGAAHRCVRFEKKYYWIPMEFKETFFNLASITTSQRSRSLFPADDFYRIILTEDQPPSIEELIGTFISDATPLEPSQIFELKEKLVQENWIDKSRVIKITDINKDPAKVSDDVVDDLKKIPGMNKTNLKDVDDPNFWAKKTVSELVKFVKEDKEHSWPDAAVEKYVAAVKARWKETATIAPPGAEKPLDRSEREKAVNSIAAYFVQLKANDKAFTFTRDALIDMAGGTLSDGRVIKFIKLDKFVPVGEGRVEFESGTAQVKPRNPRHKQEFRSDVLKLYFLNSELAAINLPTAAKLRFPDDAALQNYKQPTTKELLDRIPFQSPQVSLDSHTDPAPSVQSGAMSILRPRFLQPQAIADAN